MTERPRTRELAGKSAAGPRRVANFEGRRGARLQFSTPSRICCLIACLISGGLLFSTPQTRSIVPLRYRTRASKLRPGEQIRGFAITRTGVLFTWGDRIVEHKGPGLIRELVKNTRSAGFGASGCLTDVDNDGNEDLVVTETGAHPALVWFRATDWSRHVVDEGVVSSDMIPATLLGHRGILVIHKYNQLRFYEIPKDPARDPWPETDMYSFYTPSHEGGLALADINGDGRPDILAGNYIILSPESFDLPWHEYAIDVWTEVEPSAMLRLLFIDLLGDGMKRRVALQREMAPARFAWFDQPGDLKQLWPAHPVLESPELTQPGGLDAGDADGDGKIDLLVAESAGKGRLILLRNQGGGKFEPQILAEGGFAGAAFYRKGDAKLPEIVAVGKEVLWLEPEPISKENATAPVR